MPLQSEVFQLAIFESSGSVLLQNGQSIPFRTVCQDHLFYDEEGRAIGSMFMMILHRLNSHHLS